MLATCLLLVALAPSPLPVSDGAVATGDHYKIVSDFAGTKLSRELVGEALAAAELAWEVIGRWIDLPDELEAPLVVHLYRENAGYEAAEDKLTHGKFKRNLSFASHETRSAYLALQPPLSEKGLERLGLPLQTLRLVAHEAAHLAVYASYNNSKSHPDWFAEGLSCYVARAVLVQLTGVDSGVKLPHYSNTMLRVQQIADKDKLPTCEAHLLSEPNELSWLEGYALNLVFFDYLASKKLAPKLKKTLVELRRLGGGSSFSALALEVMKDVFGEHDFAKLDAGFAKYVQDLKPEWEVTFRSLWPQSDGSYQQIAFPGNNAIAWRTSGPKKKKWTLAGEVEVVSGRQMNILLGRSETGFVSIALVAGEQPSVSVFDFEAKTDNWNWIGGSGLTNFPLGTVASFELEVSKQRLRLTFQEQEVLNLKVPGHDFRSAWGLGAQAASAGVWQLSEVPK